MLRLDFEYVTALVSRNKLIFGAMPALQDHGNPCGLCIALSTLHLFCSQLKKNRSATGARLDTGGWLDLTRQGLSPCKVHQAALGALTPHSAARPL
jgi:hypothetical protein